MDRLQWVGVAIGLQGGVLLAQVAVEVVLGNKTVLPRTFQRLGRYPLKGPQRGNDEWLTQVKFYLMEGKVQPRAV